MKLFNQEVLRVIAEHDAYRPLPDLWLNVEKERESQRQPTYHGWYHDITAR